jgi:ubiquinone/menaquinone biosynthesis C-methylase UbiE
MDTFDERAATWDEPAKVERAERTAAAIKARVPLSGTTRLFEYGAGTGLVSQALQDAVGPITLADTSAGMREQIQRKIDDGALQDARVWDLDLSAGAAPPDERFDLVVTSLVLHHVERIDEALRAFAALLEPGGHLCVLDFDHEDGSFHGEHFHGHNGFHRHEFGALLEDAGFRDVTFEDCGTVDREGRDYPLFLATATR